MIVFNEAKKYSPEDPMAFFDFQRFADQAGDFLLVEARINFKALDKVRHDRPIVYFEIEEPNRFSSSDKAFRREEYENYFYKMLDVCPYTTAWLNKKEGSTRRQYVFFPFNENFIPPTTEKKYDIVYIGNVHSQEILNNIETMKKFNYRFVANYESKYKNEITDHNISYKEKLKLLSETKIALVHNLLVFKGKAITNIQNTAGYEENEAFRLIPRKRWYSPIVNFFSKKEYIVPQQKTRMLEAAFCRSLILCRKDPWNEIERYLEPGKEFVYYEEGQLEEKIREILEHYDDYLPIIENAYKKATQNYTTKHFFEKYLKNLT